MDWKIAVDAYPRTSVLEISDHFVLFSDEVGSEDLGNLADQLWSKEYPNSKRKGVYLTLSKKDLPLYIGKTVRQTLGDRLGKYFGTDRLTKGCRIKAPVAPPDWDRSKGHFAGWCEKPAYIVTIAVPKDMGDIPSNLEEYLIRKLKPCCNTVLYKSKKSLS